MRHAGIRSFGLVALAAVFVWLVGCKGTSDSSSGFATKSTEGDVSLKLTPEGVVDGQFVVSVQVDTHSGDLGKLDLSEAVTLHVGGDTYKPTGPVALEGHHAGGKLRFELGTTPEKFEIVVGEVRAVKPVTLRWP